MYVILNVVGGGARKKAKPKFLFPSRSHEKNLSLVVSDSSGRTSSDSIPLAVDLVVAADEGTNDSEAESQLNFLDEESELLGNHMVQFELAHKQDIIGPLMVESPNCFLEKSNQHGSSEVVCLISINSFLSWICILGLIYKECRISSKIEKECMISKGIRWLSF